VDIPVKRAVCAVPGQVVGDVFKPPARLAPDVHNDPLEGTSGYMMPQQELSDPAQAVYPQRHREAGLCIGKDGVVICVEHFILLFMDNPCPKIRVRLVGRAVLRSSGRQLQDRNLLSGYQDS
jgi:hypothetical protein